MQGQALTRRQSREVDRRAIEVYGMSGLVLMENAGRGLADVLGRLAPRGTIAICCGKGNNAGDGFVLARHLELRGQPVRVLLWADPAELRGDAAANFHILRHTEVPLALLHGQNRPAAWKKEIDGADWIVDALLGTGAEGYPRPPLDRVIEQLNRAELPILAVDVPSGLDCDTGQPAPQTIRARRTCTFFANKVGFTRPEAARYTGEVEVLDIGAPRRILAEILRDG